MCQRNDYPQRRELAVRRRCGCANNEDAENKSDVKPIDMGKTGSPRLQHGVNHVLPCSLIASSIDLLLLLPIIWSRRARARCCPTLTLLSFPLLGHSRTIV